MTNSPFASFVGPTSSDLIGAVLSVRGSEACVDLPAPAVSEDLRVTVGSFLAISAGRRRLIGVVTEVARAEADAGSRFGAVARIDMMGEIDLDATGVERFSRGVSTYPAIGDPVRMVGREELRLVYKATSERSIAIGALHNDEAIEARVDIDNLVSKHFAVLGSTGVGKSSGVAVLLNEILDARPNLRIFLLDGHNEYGRCFGSRANVVNAATLKLPFWLFNFEELVDALYYGRPGVDEEVDILAELIPIAKGMYQGHRSSSERAPLRRMDRRVGYGVDTPVPYMIQDLVALIDERMGKLENRASRMRHHHLLTRIDGLRNDARYAFMFENANVGGDTMGDILSFLFRLGESGQPMTVLQVAGLPMEVVDAVVSVLCRLAFDFGLWSDGAMPMLFVCEEAHRYAAADRSVGFAPTRRALLRIAKEGRKYGVYLGLVTQRPAELDPTIIAQCSTLFAMRMANDRDQALLRSAVTDAAANLVAFVPSLGTRELVGFGEGFPLPTRLKFKQLPAERIPRSETFQLADIQGDPADDRAFIRSVVERWRGAAGAKQAGLEEAAPAVDVAVNANPPSPVSSRIDQIRAQILKR